MQVIERIVYKGIYQNLVSRFKTINRDLRESALFW